MLIYVLLIHKDPKQYAKLVKKLTRVSMLGRYIGKNCSLPWGDKKSKVKMATLPAQKVGCLIYYGDNFLKKNVLRVIMLLFSSFKYFYFSINRNAIDKQAHFNCLKYLFSNKSTKDIFAECYNSIFL